MTQMAWHTIYRHNYKQREELPSKHQRTLQTRHGLFLGNKWSNEVGIHVNIKKYATLHRLQYMSHMACRRFYRHNYKQREQLQ